jgi:hypothetical protein
VFGTVIVEEFSLAVQGANERYFCGAKGDYQQLSASLWTQKNG